MTRIDGSNEPDSTRPAQGAIHLIPGPDGLIARLEGDADVASEHVVRQLLAGALTAAATPDGQPDRHRRLVLDLSQLRFCDLRGLSVLMDTVEQGRDLGVTVTVTGASPLLGRVWQLLRGESGINPDQGGSEKPFG